MWRAIRIVLVFTVLCGLVYPLLITGIAAGLFPHQAGGSLIEKDGKVIGSSLIAQPFADPRYFWPRPSAISPNAYDATNSGSSNLGPTSADLQKAVQDRVTALQAGTPLPGDLVTTSGSGLDPHISPAAALIQVSRVADARKLSPDTVRSLVESHVENRTLGFMGEPRVNVLELNLALDAMAK